MKHNNDKVPSIQWHGTYTIDHAEAWWRIETLTPNKPVRKDAKDLIERCLHNMEVHNMEVHNEHNLKSLPRINRVVFALDVVYRRKIDRKQYREYAMAPLYRHSDGTVMFFPVFTRTDVHEYLLRNHYPPNWERLRSL